MLNHDELGLEADWHFHKVRVCRERLQFVKRPRDLPLPLLQPLLGFSRHLLRILRNLPRRSQRLLLILLRKFRNSSSCRSFSLHLFLHRLFLLRLLGTFFSCPSSSASSTCVSTTNYCYHCCCSGCCCCCCCCFLRQLDPLRFQEEFLQQPRRFQGELLATAEPELLLALKAAMYSSSLALKLMLSPVVWPSTPASSFSKILTR